MFTIPISLGFSLHTSTIEMKPAIIRTAGTITPYHFFFTVVYILAIAQGCNSVMFIVFSCFPYIFSSFIAPCYELPADVSLVEDDQFFKGRFEAFILLYFLNVYVLVGISNKVAGVKTKYMELHLYLSPK